MVRVVFSSLKLAKEKFPNRELLAALEARDQAITVQLKAVALDAELRKDSKLLKSLLSLRSKYQSSNKWNRMALEVVVLNALRHG